MDIEFTKTSDERHSVRIVRRDGSTDAVELDSRSLLRHDFAHFAVETKVPIREGFWGSVAAGAPLTGDSIVGDEAELAESLAGPVQTLMRLESEVSHYLQVLQRVMPAPATEDLAVRIHESVRQLRGHWRATPYRGTMSIHWPL